MFNFQQREKIIVVEKDAGQARIKFKVHTYGPNSEQSIITVFLTNSNNTGDQCHNLIKHCAPTIFSVGEKKSKISKKIQTRLHGD